MNLSLIALYVASSIGSVVYASFFEWELHKNLMHRPVPELVEDVPGFNYPYNTHTLQHHRRFRADASYHLQRPEDEILIAMAWWNWPIILAVAMIPFLLGALPLALLGYWGEAIAICTPPLVVLFGYYCTYEYLHWCMHKPKGRFIERCSIFLWLKRRHFLHHDDEDKNFNVVLPLWDWIFGTLLRWDHAPRGQAQSALIPGL